MSDAIFLTDKEIAARLGMGVDKWKNISRVLEREGLPKQDVLFDSRRCWPAVLEFLQRRAGGVGNDTTLSKENGGSYVGFKSKSARPDARKATKREGGVILEMQRRRQEAGV